MTFEASPRPPLLGLALNPTPAVVPPATLRPAEADTASRTPTQPPRHTPAISAVTGPPGPLSPQSVSRGCSLGHPLGGIRSRSSPTVSTTPGFHSGPPWDTEPRRRSDSEDHQGGQAGWVGKEEKTPTTAESHQKPRGTSSSTETQSTVGSCPPTPARYMVRVSVQSWRGRSGVKEDSSCEPADSPEVNHPTSIFSNNSAPRYRREPGPAARVQMEPQPRALPPSQAPLTGPQCAAGRRFGEGFTLAPGQGRPPCPSPPSPVSAC